MTDSEFKQKAEEIWATIQKSQNILLHLHPSPDPDSAGSALAMYWVLKGLGKTPTVIKGDSDIPNWLKFLPGGDQVVPKNFTEIDLSLFDTFIIQDTGGLNQITKLSPINFPQTLKTVLIDHHSANLGFANINLIDLGSPATCQILYKLFKLWNTIIDNNIAINLISGIYTDTGGFKYSPTTSLTFAAAAELSKIAPKFTDFIFNLENNNQKEQIKFIGLALDNIHDYGQFAVSEVSYEKLEQLGIKKIHTEKVEIANEIKSVVGWNIGISFIETEKDIIKLSFRTRDSDKYDVAKIAMATGFGGGHRAAAGAILKMPFEAAKQFLLDTIYTVYPNLKP